MNSKDLKSYFEWDTISWSRAMNIWEKHLCSKKDCLALEIGSRRGGLSLMLAKEYYMKVVCSDLTSPEETAQLLHAKHQTKHKIQYRSINCTQIHFPDNTFDVVVFKSVIGALSTFEKQQIAFNEMLRVLKPGGVLLFAENLEASKLHMFLRKKFIPWNTYWRYPNLSETYIFLNKYNKVEIDTTGFFATLLRTPIFRTFLSYFDFVFEKVISKRFRYIVYGVAEK